mgnify:CR=1 FL=1|jgi:hypothetical protein
MQARRIFFFTLSILLGIGAGLLFGWRMMPPKAPVDAPMTSLRADFKTDLVLMTAEFYQNNPDTFLVLDELAKISPEDPISLIGTSLTYAKEIGYPLKDQQLLENLLTHIDLELYQEWKDKRGMD